MLTAEPGPSKYPASLRLHLQFDPQRLALDLALADQVPWPLHFHSEDFIGDWRGIALRSVSGSESDLQAHPALDQTYVDTPLLQRCGYFRELIAALGLHIRGARLLSLSGGSAIKPHRDPHLAYRFGEFRLHIPIVTAAGVDFRVGGARVDMRPGQCWYFDFDQVHSVANRGPHRRVHLVLDGARDAASDALFVASGFDVQAQPAQSPMDAATRKRIIDELNRQGTAVATSLAAALSEAGELPQPEALR